MKPIFIVAEVEWYIVHPETGEGIWGRYKRMQIEKLSRSAIYFRGLGGGYALWFVREENGKAVFKPTGERHPATRYRISIEDYNRLVKKWRKARG
jgi:hypothetical protein